MGEHSANIDFLPVVMDRRNQPSGVAADIEDRQLSNLISTRKERVVLRMSGQSPA
jgi:hypothetical protein